MPVGVHLGDIAGQKPAIHNGLFGGLGIFIIADKDTRPALHQLTIRGDLIGNAADRLAHCAQFDIIAHVDKRKPGALGHAVAFLGLNADRVKKAQHFRANLGCC